MNSFENVPVENDTIVIFSEKIAIGFFIVLFQKWSWDGIDGESIIFTSYDALRYTDEELFILTQLSLLVEKHSDMTLKRDVSGYTFVNFNFSALT